MTEPAILESGQERFDWTEREFILMFLGSLIAFALCGILLIAIGVTSELIQSFVGINTETKTQCARNINEGWRGALHNDNIFVCADHSLRLVPRQFHKVDVYVED